MLIFNLALLVFLEAILSMDNALALALIVRRLPKAQQSKALCYGMWGAYLFRLASLLLLTTILKFWWLKLLGAIYLVYMVVSYFVSHGEADVSKEKTASRSFWTTVAIVELTDVSFSLDSIVATLAVTRNLVILVAAAFIGIALMRLASTYMIKMLDLFPGLEETAYLLILVVAIKLGAESFGWQLSPYVQYPVMAGLLLLGLLPQNKSAKASRETA